MPNNDEIDGEPVTYTDWETGSALCDSEEGEANGHNIDRGPQAILTAQTVFADEAIAFLEKN